MKTLNITLIIATVIVIFASSCSDPSKEVFPENGPRIENKDTNPGNGQDDTSKDEDSKPKEEKDKIAESGCGIRIPTTDLPKDLAMYITQTYTQKAPYYYIAKVEVCKENREITKYTVTLDGPHEITLQFDGNGNTIN